MHQRLLGGLTLISLLTPIPLPGPVLRPALPESAAQAYRRADQALRVAGGPYRSWAAVGRRFLAFDLADGTAAEVVGDLASADHVAVLIPGVSTRLADFDRGLGGVARRAPAVQARHLHAAMRAAAGDRVAVVAWLGYHPPDGVGLEAARDARARIGARRLSAFVEQHVSGAGRQITLVGHSYGAIVAGLAAQRLPDVHDVVALGAPGVGVDHADDLGGAHVWTALAATDWIRRVPQIRLGPLGHGRRPSSAGFGATALPTAGVDGHDFYLDPAGATLSAVARVTVGGQPVGAARNTGGPVGCRR